MILTHTLMKALKLFPRKQAIVCGGKRWTYEEFGNRINRLSHCLKSFGIKKNDKVAILHPNCHIFLEAYYAIPQIGAISVPINHRLSGREIAFILQDSESRILIADSTFKNQIDLIRKEIPAIEKILWAGENKISDGPGDLNYERALAGADSSLLSESLINGEDGSCPASGRHG